MVPWHLVFREGLGDVLSDDYDLLREDLPVEVEKMYIVCPTLMGSLRYK